MAHMTHKIVECGHGPTLQTRYVIF